MKVDIKTWQRLFPELYTEDLMCFCGRPSQGWQTFLNGDMAGLEAQPCECGRNGITVMQPRNEAATDKWISILNGFVK